MGHGAKKPAFTASDFLLWEADQLDRHEYLDGEVFAMAGVEDRHVTVSMKVAFAVRQHHNGSPSRTHRSGMRLRVEAANAYFYPNVSVTCSPQDHASPHYNFCS